MSWVTLVWAMLIGGCAAMALPQIVLFIWQRRAAHLFFLIATAGVIGIAIGELIVMHSHSTEQIGTTIKWAHISVFALVVGLVGFVWFYFGTGRWWLAVAACGLRFVCLVINFAFPPNLNFRAITSIHPINFLGDVVSTPEGIISPWTHLGELSSVLALVFVVDASISLWRQGKPETGTRALVVGGSITVFILLAAGVSALKYLRVIEAPYLVSFPFAAILLAMAFEMGRDMLCAFQLAQRLRLREASLCESEERFRMMADAAPVLIWESGPDKLCIFFNKTWLNFTGRTMEQELGNGWSEGVHPDDFEQCLKTYVAAFDSRERFVMQYRLRRHDGEYRWITDNGVPRQDARGEFVGYIGSAVDVTDLLKKEEVLREFEERVNLAAEAAHLGFWELDTVTEKVWMSDSACTLFQLEPETRLGYAAFQDRIHPQDRALHDAAVRRAIETQGGYEMEYRALLPDGTLRWIGGRARCVRDPNGGAMRLLGVSMDISARQEAEEEARRRREEIGRLSRMSLLGEIAASIAHEVNQPLSGILSNASAGQRFIDRGDVDLAEIREILVDVAADGRRAHEVIRNIRNTIKHTVGIRQRFDLNDVVTKVAHMIQPDTAAHSCELKTSLGKDLPVIEGDPIQIQEVLINLVSNALEAMRQIPVGGRELQITTERSGDDTICVSVSDRGVGIAEAVHGRLFEQFFTTKKEGLGMGLSIVRSIIETHGGKIGAENLDGGGARFAFTLPINSHLP